MSPNASFGYRIYDFAQNVSFYNDKSGTPNGSIISYLWDFGDGQTATGQKIAHFYNPGSYFVTLTVVDTAGLRSSETQHVTIYQTGSDLIADVDCSLAEPFVEFTQQCKVTALDKQGQISKVRLTWGDGTAAVNLSLTAAQGINKPTHNYAAVGTYPIRLSVFTSRGETKTMDTSVTLINYVPPSPPVVASLYCYTSNLLVSCNALGSYDRTGGILTYSFDYGDSFTETNANGISAHAYSSAGLFIVSLKVTNANGDQALAQAQVQPLFPANLLPSPVLTCFSNKPQVLTCNASGSFDQDGTIVFYSYSWDDNTDVVHGESGEIFHLFTTAGSHQVTLTETDNDGGVSSITNSFDIKSNQSPVANAHCSNTASQTVTCQSFSYDPDGTIASTRWILEDGTVIWGNNFTNIFEAVTSTKIKLEVTDDLGTISSTEQTVFIFVNQLPTFNLIASTTKGILPLNVNFQALNVSDNDGTIASYKWMFPDGTTFDKPNALYTFTTAGSYNVKLQVTDNNGGMTEKSIIIGASDSSNLIILTDKDNGLATLDVHFNASESTDPDGQIVKYEWFYQNEKVGEGDQLDYLFDEIGPQSMTLQTTNNYGVTFTKSKIINVDQPPIYLAGKFKRNILANYLYQEPIALITGAGIARENINLSLVDAPEGVTISGDGARLEWNPTNNQAGAYSFSILASDGVLSFAKKININVVIPNLVAQFIAPNTGGTFTVNNPNSSLNGTKITTPTIESPNSIDVSLLEWRDSSNKTIFKIVSSEELNDPINLEFPNERSFEPVIKDAFDAESLSSPTSWANLGINTLNALVCARIEYRSGPPDEMGGAHYSPVYANASVILEVDDNILKSNRLINVISSSKYYPFILNGYPAQKYGPLKIYLTYNENVLKGAPGATPLFSDNYFFINIKEFEKPGYNDEYLQHTLMHEAFHIIQNHAVGCRKRLPLFTSSTTSMSYLMEGAADYYADKNLTEIDQLKVWDLDQYFGRFSTITNKGQPTEKRELDYLSYANHIIREGIFSNTKISYEDGKKIVKPDTYGARYLWGAGNSIAWGNGDHNTGNLKLELDKFLNFFKNDVTAIDTLDENYGKKLFKNFALSQSLDPSTLFLALIDVNFFHTASNFGGGDMYNIYFRSPSRLDGKAPFTDINYADGDDSRLEKPLSNGTFHSVYSLKSFSGEHKYIRSIENSEMFNLNTISLVSIVQEDDLAFNMYSHYPKAENNFDMHEVFASKRAVIEGPNANATYPGSYNLFKDNSYDYLANRGFNSPLSNLHFNMFNLHEAGDKKVEINVAPLCRSFHRTQQAIDNQLVLPEDLTFKTNNAFTYNCGKSSCEAEGLEIYFCLFHRNENNFCIPYGSEYNFVNKSSAKIRGLDYVDDLLSEVLVCQTKFPNGLRLNIQGIPTYDVNFYESNIDSASSYRQ
ncbi:MAG: PKD domain-containing protein [Bacteriovorax sp.]|nr:PKD domain-containing protein [Bacteriovorax sp.]